MSKRMTERQLSKAIVELAERLGWRCYTIAHTKWGGLRSHTGIGWPDLFLVRNGIAIAAELKTSGRGLTGPQEEWLMALDEVPGVYAFVWREKDWTSGEVQRVLTCTGR